MARVTKPKDEGEQFAAFMDTLAEAAIAATDRELIDDAAAAGIDIKVEGARVRGVLGDAVLSAKKERLKNAAAAHERSVAAFNARTARIPAGAEAQRRLLDRLVNRSPAMRQTVMTLQHREFDELSEADVASALRQLDALGYLDDDLASDE